MSDHTPGRAETAGIVNDAVVDAYKPGIDVTLLRANLRLTVEERVVQLIRAVRLVEEARGAIARARPRPESR